MHYVKGIYPSPCTYCYCIAPALWDVANTSLLIPLRGVSEDSNPLGPLLWGLGGFTNPIEIATFHRTGTMHKHVLRKTGEFPHTPKRSECFLFETIYHLVKTYERRARCGSIRPNRIHTPFTYISSSSQCSHA